MKKTSIIFSILFTMTTGAFAQIENGAVLVGASSNLSLSSLKPKDGDSQSLFILDAKLGYFLAENFVAGIQGSYQSFDESSATAFGVFARYYISGKVFLGAGYQSATEKTVIDLGFDEEEFTSTYTQIPLEFGVAAFVTNAIAIEPSFNYTLISGDLEGSTIGLNVGFNLYLNRGKE